MQIRGSKVARLGVLFSASQEADSSSLLFVKAFEVTASTYRCVKCLRELCAIYLSVIVNTLFYIKRALNMLLILII